MLGSFWAAALSRGCGFVTRDPISQAYLGACKRDLRLGILEDEVPLRLAEMDMSYGKNLLIRGLYGCIHEYIYTYVHIYIYIYVHLDNMGSF